jgi:hypothetical protein
VEDLQPIVDEMMSMGCHRDASGHWGHQQSGTQRGADLDRLIHLFSAVEQHYATQRVGQIVRLAADVQQSGGWQEDRHQEALLAAGFVQDPKSGQYSHPLSYIPAVQAAVITLFEVIKNPRPQTTPPPPTPPPSPWRPQGPR